MARYKYHPLANNHIRVLTLLPGERQDPITCTLDHVDLAKGPDFKALSYEWGVPDFKYQANIHSTGDSIPITTSLWNALRDLRQTQEPQTIWADAICINQQDYEERSSQVLLMGQLYQSASLVVVYGGPETEYTRSGIPLAKQVIPISSVYIWLTEHGLPPSDDSAWEALRSLLPWAQRAWMVQESMLNENNIFQLSQEELNWTLLPGLLFDSKSGHLQPEHPATSNLYLLSKLRGRKAHDERTLQVLLPMIRTFHCQDPRDKVFCVLGFASDSDELAIQPDYRASVEEVYIDVAVRILRNSDTLDLLSHVRPGQFSSGLPSGFLIGLITIILHALHTLSWQTIRGGMGRTAPEGVTISEPEFSKDSLELSLNALFEAHNSGQYGQWMTEHIPISFARGRYSENSLEAFLKTLWAGTDPRDAINVRNMEEAIPGASGRITMEVIRDSMKQALWGDDAPNTPTSDPTPRAVVAHFVKILTKYSKTRSFSITKDGYFCLTPQQAQEGDSVVIMKGGRVLYVVRKRGDKYTFIGEAYVEGLMNGEAFDEDSDLELNFERITLV
ncbi:HET-domain-containing protein [Aspergillus sclerotiicarbonarius CBS 121057]|uniref:HET-domain-containing protein n=1 Tax=Aspergillus sclerotiicarbonarius (strain CBS 121057 / IBT 28362) TaxID=1448318 RepID=A0A319EQB9_ASPSB|nr:HET-domain-containing protein [Aspergillus sclerotiicarbonarius CBS 121057]